ncbi:MAG TPA: alpha/beta fold hydrolase [Baekduia sp.]|uniref:alpha/beta fold hydrolase n=1 Tax=Baekduia sp. TaxID=2600305 RepID=UPI002D7686E8|nr:alpha/beta fold hydrolase [Baekduia sp.]HET6505727.1 alpha/beta fold hydrolase [Baekduia sp.]
MLARRPFRSVVLTGALAAFACALAPTGASAALPWAACQPAGYECSTLPVPLDRANPAGANVTLSVARVRAASNPNNVAVVPLAGGPGQAALPLKSTFASVLAPAIADRDLLVFDQRGTGASGALNCPALSQRGSIVKIAASCANQIGPQRGFYRTADSVQDIEALRVANGYSKLVLFGVSYGTKVAEDYAAAYPQNVEALVLDSVVLPEGPDPFQRSTMSSAPRVLRDLCAGKACRGATDSVTRDLSSLTSKLRKKSLKGKVVLSSGKRTSLSMGQDDLLAILLAGDLNPTLRAELPGSMRAALRDDASPLLRLAVRSEGLTTGLKLTGHQSEGGDSDALFLATTCEEAPFAWTRAAGAEQRYAEITAAAKQIPKAQLGPFSPAAAVGGGPVPYCLGWPDASPAPVASAPLPPVRTLVLDGQMDLRTPYEDAAQIAQRIPGASVVEVPNTGHSTVSSDLTEDSACTKTALSTFFAGGAPTPCAASSNPYAPTPRPPTGLKAIKASSASKRTIIAAEATVTDAARQIIGDALALGALPHHVGGLRAGNATINKSGSFRLNAYQYVKGVVVSGTVDENRNAKVTIHGGGALRGTLKISASGAVNGTLGGKKVTLAASASLRSSLPSIRSVLAKPELLAKR